MAASAPATTELQSLFQVTFPGEIYSEGQNPRLAAQLRLIADRLSPAGNQGADQDAERRESGSAATGSDSPLLAQQPQTKKQRRSKGRLLDFNAYHRRYVALEIAYLGWGYQGFASQADSENTIEGQFFAALRRVKLVPEDADWQALQYSRCGRTDKGVSAVGQVVALQLRSCAKTTEQLPAWSAEQDYPLILNRVLPDAIRVLGWVDVPEDFHARFGARYREYKYFVVQQRDSLDLAAMLQASAHFLGEHDFRNFCKMDVEHVTNFKRTILDFRIDECDGSMMGRSVYALYIRGTAFLWHQVRCMAAVLLMVGQGLEAPNIVAQLLDTDTVSRKPHYNMAAEEPLLFCGAAFKHELQFRRSLHSQLHLRDMMSTMLNRQLISANVVAAVEARVATDVPDEAPVAAGEAARAVKAGTQHIKLLQRQREPSFEERAGKLAGR